MLWFENDGLLSLSLSSRGREGTGNARYLQAREGLGQHALTSSAAPRRRIVRYIRYRVRLPRRSARWRHARSERTSGGDGDALKRFGFSIAELGLRTRTIQDPQSKIENRRLVSQMRLS